MSRRRILAAIALTTMAFATSSAFATPGDKDANRCDYWWRDGDATDGSAYDDNGDQRTMDNYSEQPNGRIAPAAPTNPYVTQESGHYVAGNSAFYVEIIGGNDYRRPLGDTENGARGGAVQGEVEAPTGHDADFHASTFFGSDGANRGYVEKNLCVNANNARVVDQFQCATVPQEGNTTMCPLV